MSTLQRTTLCFLFTRETPPRVLLARKLRGFGAGRVNAPGGKATPGERAVAAAVREVHEEVGVELAESDVQACGVLEFRFERDDWPDQHCFVFKSRDGFDTAQMCASDEMAPFLVSCDSIDYSAMWPDDRVWLPELLAGRTDIFYRFAFDANGAMIGDGERLAASDFPFVDAADSTEKPLGTEQEQNSASASAQIKSNDKNDEEQKE